MPSITQITDNEAQAAFVFTGKVIKSRAATMPEIPTEDTLIVQIEHIIKAPAMFSSLTGQQITVRFQKLPEIKEGAIITVFANGWIFGESIAVDAVNYSEETDKNGLASMVGTSVIANSDNALKERIDSAGLGVVGKVVKIEKAAIKEEAVALMSQENAAETKTTRISEHDPNWHEATIQVDEVVKGGNDAKEVKVLFPKSDDVRWYKIHKFQVGQQGIWLLQKGKTQNPNGIAPKLFAAIPEEENVLTALHDYDYLPLHELGKVKSLLNK